MRGETHAKINSRADAKDQLDLKAMTAIKGNPLASGLHHVSLLPSPGVPDIYKMHPEVSAKCVMKVKSPTGQCWW